MTTLPNRPNGRYLPADPSDPIRKLIVRAFVHLLMDFPFYGTLITYLEPVEVTWCKTACTDLKHFFYNRDFIKSLNFGGLLFLCGHEVLHGVLGHFLRRGNRDPKLFNMAADFIVNAILVRERVGQMPAIALYDPAYTDEMSVEELYDLLLKECVTVRPTLDEHLDSLGDHQSPCDDGDPRPTFDPEELERNAEAFRDAMEKTAVQLAGAGSLPAGIARLLGSMNRPKIDWRSVIDQHIRSQVRANYTYQRPSRRSFESPFIFPAQDVDEEVDLWVFIDASFSTTEEMVTDFLSETIGIIDCWRSYKLHIASFDTQVYNVITITPENHRDLYHYAVHGDGGTAFECIFAYLREHEIEPRKLVVFTDGLPNRGWGEPTYCDTLFVIHSHRDIVAPYGMTVHYERG